MHNPLRKDVRMAKSPDFVDAELRRWRDPAETSERDNRPGHYSVTGAFVELPDCSKTKPHDASK